MAFLALLFLFLLVIFQVKCSSGACNVYEGSWVIDKSYPLYNNITCPFIWKDYNCQKNGRPDSEYLKYRWQPTGCNLPRFNGLDFLKRYQGKHILFVGDSIGVDQWSSLTCLLHSVVPDLKYSSRGEGGLNTFTIPAYDIKVSMDFNRFLVDIIPTPKGKILTLDSIKGGKKWFGMDMLIFNTWHWWSYTKPGQPWDYIQVGNKTFTDLDRSNALEMGLATWANWVDTNVDSKKTKIFFTGVSPDHYEGAAWGKPKSNCVGETMPVLGSTYPGPYPTAPVNVIKSRLAKMRTQVILLDITALTLLRKDGHASMYDGMYPAKGPDCTHWCLAGVPDTWNQILYSIIASGQY